VLEWFRLSRKTAFILLCIIILAAAVRFYHLPQNADFDFDQEFAATFAYQVVHVFPIQMTGQSLSVEGLFDGPFYFYLMTPFFMMTRLHPIGGFIGSGVLGLVIILTYFFVLRDVFGEKTALLGAFLRAILFTKITGDIYLNPAFSAELAALLTWFCFYKYWKGDQRFILPLAFIMGMYTSFHPTLFPFYIVFVLVIVLRRKIPSLKLVLASVFLFLLPLMPLIAFEYFRKLEEIKVLLSVNHSQAVEARGITTILTYLKLYFSFPSILLGKISLKDFQVPFQVLILAMITFAAVKRMGFWKESFHIIFILLTVFSFTFYYYLLRTHSPEYHFLGIETLFFIYFTGTLGLLFKKNILIPIVIAVFIALFNFYQLNSFWNRSYRDSLYDKDKIVKEISRRTAKSKQYSVYYDADFGQQYGFGYLQRYYGIDSKGSGTSYMISIPAKSNVNYALSSGGIGLTIKNQK
jgi:hypothetical protein